MAQSHILVGANESTADPIVRHIGPADLFDALSSGIKVFSAMPSHAVFLCVIYPIVGFLLAGLTLGYSMLPLFFPLAAGFALIGPFAALGLYELSRRREAGAEVTATDAFEVMRSPSIGAIAALGFLFALIFLVWIATANAIYVAHFGYAAPASIGQFAHDLFMTPAGWSIILIGNGVGFLFAVTVLMASVVSFPLLLDREVGAAVAVLTSLRVVLASPFTMALWGLIVAVLLALGSLPMFLGLPVVVPVLGHATWHLYRKAVEAGRSPRAEFRPQPTKRHLAADFPVSLFTSTEPTVNWNVIDDRGGRASRPQQRP